MLAPIICDKCHKKIGTIDDDAQVMILHSSEAQLQKFCKQCHHCEYVMNELL